MLKIFISIVVCMSFTFFNHLTYAENKLIRNTVPKIKPIDIKVKIPKDELKKYIIEVTDPNIITKMKETYPNIKLEEVFNTVFQGASIKSTENDIEIIKKQLGIKQIYPVSTYKVKLDESVPFIGGTLLRGEFDAKNQRLTGKGIKVGVIDTGIDYTHPDLQRNYQGGFDLVDKDDDPMETIKSQGRPTLHGTHVAGIIAANGKIQGVAPDAEIYAYRCLGPGGVGTSDQVIAAIEKAVEDGMDIINLSLGSSVNGPDYPTSVALDHAVEKGVIAVTSNGNSGPGLWTVGSPGTSSKAISVGASTPPLEIPYLELEFAEDKPIMLQPFQGSIPWNLSKSYKLVYGGLGNVEELKDVKGKIVLIERGVIPFTEKVKNAYKRGAKAVLIFNNEDGIFAGGIEGEFEIPIVALSKEDGQFLKEKIEKGSNWAITKTHIVNDHLADFSSRGPVAHNWGIKPDVVAPGVEIDSTVPNGYIALQGTSMSSPHVAGAAALIKQAHPEWNPEQVKAALMNTAKPLYNEKGKLYIPYEQGAGRIQLEKAVSANVLAYPGSLAFGSVNSNNVIYEKTIKVTVENKSKQTKKISLQTPEFETGVKWQLPISFYLEPMEKKSVPIGVKIDVNDATKGIHYGIVKIESSSDVIQLPYLFLVGETNYPRVSGFSFEKENEEEDIYKYELYLPEGADELGIALFDPLSLKFVGLLHHKRNVERGLIEVVKQRKEIPYHDGDYHVIVYAINKGIETYEEGTITIGKNIVVPETGH